MNNFDIEFEKAIRFITDAMPPAEELEKPTLAHSIRVGVYLYNKGYKREICIAGLLHDAIEDTNLRKEVIEKEFGKEISDIVVANTKNDSLLENEKWNKLIEQCINYGEDALIVKAADILDNYIYYSRINNSEGLSYTKNITKILIEMTPDEYKNDIFKQLKQTVV